eukprot:gene13823-13938_t
MRAELQLAIAPTISKVPAEQWDACANPRNENIISALSAKPESGSEKADSKTQVSDSLSEETDSLPEYIAYNPFISHAFLSSLERSGSVGNGTGWQPAHVLLKDGNGQIEAACPLYLKTHSMGEYVFDQGWAQAYERAGGVYYPKLQMSVPFTPATGRRLLLRHPAHAPALIEAVQGLRASLKASSIHATFLPEDQWETLGRAGFLQRTDQQFHFFNEGYSSFDDFLAALSSRKRKMIRRERKEALSAGVTIEWLTGTDIEEHHWDAFFAFYMDTGERKWGRPYLTRRFFSEIGSTMPQDILLVMAKREGRYIAGAINFIGGDALYGRNWGALEHHPFLHFEVCYYQAIDFAIARKLARVEAGAQGEHKLARGYKPVITYSAHEIADPRLKRAVADYLVAEREAVFENAAILGQYTPFRHSESERDMDGE